MFLYLIRHQQHPQLLQQLLMDAKELRGGQTIYTLSELLDCGPEKTQQQPQEQD